MKVISFLSLKGGVGKSSSALSTAGILAETGRRVLFMDLDPQNAGTSHFGDFSENPTVRDVLHGKLSMFDVIQQTKPVHLVPSCLELALIDLELQGRPNQFFLLHEAIQDISGQYDFLVIDTPPQVGLLSKSAWITSDCIIIPAQLDKWSVRAVMTTIQANKEASAARRYIGKTTESLFILPTFYEENRPLKDFMRSELERIFGDLVFVGNIHAAVDVPKTYAQTGETLPRASRAWKEYRAFVEYIIPEIQGA